MIRIKVPNGQVQVVQQSTGANLPTDVICSNSTDTTDCDLFFKDTFASFSIGYYYLKPSTASNQVTPQTFAPNTVYSINANQSIVENFPNYIYLIPSHRRHKICQVMF